MPFLDIAFQAEISRFEDQEFEELAWRNCSEDPKTRDKIIQELRTMIKERGECNPRRNDDAYLLRFLRCRRFRPELAYKLMVRYEDFRRNSAQLYDCDPFTLHKVKNVYAGVVPENPVNGRIVIVKCSGWDPSVAPVTDLTRVALIMNEVTLLQPKMQILGFTLILDLGGLSITQMRHLSPTFAYQTVSVLGVSFPLMVHGLHIINYSRLLSPAFYIFKQFIPTSIWNRLCFHGSDVKTLHRYIDPEFLPPEYGGTCRCIAKFEEWITKIDLYKDDFLVRELRDLGYTVK